MKSVSAKIIIGVIVSLLYVLPAHADYNCEVFIKHKTDALTPVKGFDYDVPDFRASGHSKFGYNSFADWVHFLPAGGLIADAILNSPNRWRNCMDKSMKQTFTATSYTSIFDGIMSVQGDPNAKVNFCMQPRAMERGEGGYMSHGLEFEFKARQVLNRSKWGYQDVLIFPPKSYCATYYEDECFAPIEVESEAVEHEDLNGEYIEDLFEDDEETSADNWEPGSNTDGPSSSPPPEYCEPKPFEMFDATPDEAWTPAGKSPLYPVDINGDFKSDIVMRHKDFQGQVFRTYLSNGDGSFISKSYRSGESFLDTYGVLAGYFNDDAKTDLLLRDREAGVGLVFYTKLSNGDGTYNSVRHVDGDEKQKRSLYGGPAMVGDVDGDGMSDVVVTYQHPTLGLQIGVKFSNGDGTFRSTFMNNEERNLQSARYHLADVNNDKKSDLVITYARVHDLHIRSYLSNGDGTFHRRDFNPGVWFNREKFQSFVSDLNRDKRTDVVVLHRTPAGDLFANTFMGNGDGTFNKSHQSFPEDRSVDDFDAMVVDVDGDHRSDIVLRRRDPVEGLIIISKISNGDGTFASYEFRSGEGSEVDNSAMFVGNYNTGAHADLGLRYLDGNGNIALTTKMGGSSGFSTSPALVNLGNDPNQLNPITGPLRWNGGGTFNPRRPATVSSQVLGAERAVISQDLGESGGVSDTDILVEEPKKKINMLEGTQLKAVREYP